MVRFHKWINYLASTIPAFPAQQDQYSLLLLLRCLRHVGCSLLSLTLTNVIIVTINQTATSCHICMNVVLIWTTSRCHLHFKRSSWAAFTLLCTSQSSCSMLSGQKPLKFKWVTSLHEKGNITLNINVINCNNNNNKSKKTSMNSLEVLLNTIYYMKNLQTIVWIFSFICRRTQRRLHRQTEIVMLNTDVCVCVSVGGPEETWEASQVVTPHERYLIVSNDFCTLPSTTCGFSLLSTLSQTKTRQIQRLFYISTTWSHPCQQQIVGVFFPELP